MKRRTWILSALGATGALVVGWGALPPRSRLGSAANMLATQDAVALNGWIKIAQDGSVVLAMPRSEMGQGVYTGLSMLVAEELDVGLAQVHLEQAGTDAIYGNVAMLLGTLPFHPLDYREGANPASIRAGEWVVSKLARELGLIVTGGSSSITDAWEPLRMAAATARASLVAAAAARWQVSASDITIDKGVLKHASGKSANFGEFAQAAAASQPANVTPKDRKDWKLVGTSAPRTDLVSKTNGSAQFGLDVRLPDMVFAAVRMSPMLGGSAGALDTAAALALPGVQQVVALEPLRGASAGFAVIAKTTWHARQGAQAVQTQWQQRSQGALNSQNIAAELQNQLDKESGLAFHTKGDIDGAEKSAAQTLEASYTAPYLAHATMEPMNCTAQFKDGKLEIWAPTQAPSSAREAAAKAAGISQSDVTLHVTLLGGGFGRRLEVDFIAQAAKLAKATSGKPVQLSWSREEDMGHDFYRPMHAARLKATFDAQGQPQSLRIQSAGDAISPRWMERAVPLLAGPVDMPDKTTAEGLFDLPYGFAHQRMAHVTTHMGVPVGFWRSVGHSHNAFFSESFIDELAAASHKDPLEFRRSLLQEAPRYLAVLNLAAEQAKWGSALPAGRARGIALHESFGSIVAQVAEVSVQDGVPRVHRVVCAIDCGTVVNPGLVAQQMESAVVFGLSAALWGKIDIVDGVVQQTNFTNYPMVKMAQAPVVETHVVSSTRKPTGVGEPGLPPLAPAVSNALFTLTGKRHRSLPLVA